MIQNARQKTLDWFRNRLGHFTGSQVGLLMKKGRAEDFSDTAKSYIYQVAAERSMNPAIINNDDAFADYLDTVNIETKAMKFGTEQEADARNLYSMLTKRKVVEVGSCRHPTIPYFASSPDGFLYDEETGVRGCIEIKVPSQSTFMKYKSEVKDNDSLLKVKYEYFYQCMAHMMNCEADWTDFVVYNPYQIKPVHIVHILPDKEVFDEMEKRIRMANDIVEELIKG